MNGVSKPVTIQDILKMKGVTKIAALTAYDATFARLFDEAGLDVILVGDSLGMVIQGHDTTLPVTLDEMIYHTRICSRGVKRALLISDMPFMTYQASVEQALVNCARCIKEGGARAVKLEGGEEIAPTIHRLVVSGIPVMGHIGMQPQRVNEYGGYSLQGRNPDEAEHIMRDALAVQAAGAFAIVLEKIPTSLAGQITRDLRIPTIGIASGPECDGQILVSYDMLGLADQFKFRFVRRYLEGAQLIRDAVKAYAGDIRAGKFPSAEESFE
ncbi:MAG: 3-methyl-2-oxobutanoate hydroxymethyltransferase [Calditrichaeota bacterium]|nr:3-methyl-2-oxobutanoate hydroxymethyltransferase [Calditrichota bacterium]